MRGRRAFLAAVMAIVLVGTPGAVHPAALVAAGPVYHLPAPAGTKLVVTQGQNTPDDHNLVNHSLYAWDFGIAGNGEFDVTAVRAGTVIGLRDNSQAHCYQTATGTFDWSCWKDANYALVDHGDGTSALYVHLATGSAVVQVGDHVVAGQKLARDDNTGFSSANHLHFMVETTPAVPNTPPPGPTDKTTVAWWWTNSLPITLSDPDVLAQTADDIPKYGATYMSGAPTFTPTPTPTPKPTPKATPLRPPAAPTNVTFVDLRELLDDPFVACSASFANFGLCSSVRVRWTWTGPSVGVRLRIYYVSGAFYDCADPKGCGTPPTPVELCQRNLDEGYGTGEVLVGTAGVAVGRVDVLTPRDLGVGCIRVVAENAAGRSARVWATRQDR